MVIKIKSGSTWNPVNLMKIRSGAYWNSITTAYIRLSNTWKLFFSIGGPTQTVSVGDTGGSAAAGSNVTAGSSGSYTNYISVSTELISVITGTSVSNGSTASSGTVLSSPHTVTQAEATTPQTIFYTRDSVLGLDGTTYYYYYSANGATAYIPSFTDNFNRSNNSTEIGTSSSGLVYSSYKNPATNTTDSWGISSNAAYNSYIPGYSDSGSSYPMRTLDVHKTNVSLSASIPSGGGGPGLAFWVTARGSWWAASPYYYQATTTTSYCNGPPISTNAGGSGCSCPVQGYTCYTNYGFTCDAGNCYGLAITQPNACSSTGYYCGSTTYEVGVIDPGPTYVCSASTVGQICSKTYNLNTNQFIVTYCESGTYYSDGYNCYQGVTTCYECNTVTSSSTTTYYSTVKIWSASGSSAVSEAEKELANSTSGYTKIYGISVGTESTNKITVKGYSNTTLSTQLGSDLTLTPASPTKSLANGESSVGIIKLNTANNLGTDLDNFTYTRI